MNSRVDGHWPNLETAYLHTLYPMCIRSLRSISIDVNQASGGLIYTYTDVDFSLFLCHVVIAVYLEKKLEPGRSNVKPSCSPIKC